MLALLSSNILKVLQIIFLLWTVTTNITHKRYASHLLVNLQSTVIPPFPLGDHLIQVRL